ncbi:MAG: glycosyltransferase [Planctomycetota bacterium]|nr:glycosyltransferase [Planctomycetota bacterium]
MYDLVNTKSEQADFSENEQSVSHIEALHVAADATSPCTYDGIICFGGEDWWYHNRGHYDLQMMREFSRDMPVLYVNSIGMRMPSAREGRMFMRRMMRKLKSLRRGMVRIRENFAVLSPFTVPGGIGQTLSGWMLAPQVRRASRALGIHRPLVWVACPPAAIAVNALDPIGVVYQRTDRHECYSKHTHDMITRCDQWLKARADMTVFCSRVLQELEDEQCRQSCLIDHGVDFQRFAEAGLSKNPIPEDVRSIPGPRVGFIGGIDAHTFDPELFNDVAMRLPDVQFVLVGACSLPEGWCALPNVTQLGRKPYEQVADYMAACDVLIMPWNKSQWIEACNPVKLKEYLAVGRPIVSTDFPELRRYQKHVRIATNADEFACAIKEAIRETSECRKGRALVRNETWNRQSDTMLRELQRCGLATLGSRSLLDTILLTPLNDKTLQSEPIVEHKETVITPSDSPDILALIGCQDAEQDPLTSVSKKERVLQRSITPESEASIVLAGCFILAGGLKPSPLAQLAGCSVLDLSLQANQTVLQRWIELIESIPGIGKSPIRVIHGDNHVLPMRPPEAGENLEIECEPRSWRGPAGALRDVTRRIDSNAHLLVVEGMRCHFGTLDSLVDHHASREADVTIGMNADGSPAGVYMVRVDALSCVEDLGYVDLKEQWLPRVQDEGGKVEVHEFASPNSRSLRTLNDFLNAARILWSANRGDEISAKPSTGLIRGQDAQNLRIICPGAFVGPGATLLDSIVMPGSVIPPDMTIVRSLICPETRIQVSTDIADAIVSESACLSDHG